MPNCGTKAYFSSGRRVFGTRSARRPVVHPRALPEEQKQSPGTAQQLAKASIFSWCMSFPKENLRGNVLRNGVGITSVRQKFSVPKT
jgi:hypothetical protein